MKNIHFTIFGFLFFCLTAATLPNPYEEAMTKAIDELHQAQSPEALQQAGNTFERIARKATDKWHPRYYAAYAQVMLTTRSQESSTLDKTLDTALEQLKAAKELAPQNSELLALEGFIHMMRIPIDPATRGPQYSGLAMGALQQAIALNPENPRAHFLLSDMQFGMAQFFGSDTSEACATLEKAIGLFEQFTPEDKLAPNWGREMAIQSKQQKGC